MKIELSNDTILALAGLAAFALLMTVPGAYFMLSTYLDHVMPSAETAEVAPGGS